MLLAVVSSDVTNVDWYACMALKLLCGALAVGTHGGQCSNGNGAAGVVDLAARPSFPGVDCLHHMRMLCASYAVSPGVCNDMRYKGSRQRRYADNSV